MKNTEQDTQIEECQTKNTEQDKRLDTIDTEITNLKEEDNKL